MSTTATTKIQYPAIIAAVFDVISAMSKTKNPTENSEE
jgi:hypothetical protein